MIGKSGTIIAGNQFCFKVDIIQHFSEPTKLRKLLNYVILLAKKCNKCGIF
jgi:hypothetical protein